MSLHGHELVWADEAEIVFLVIYTTEILLRCIAEQWGCLFDWWFLFDFTLVLSACVEQVAYVFTGSSAEQIMILRLLRLIRLVRSFRMIKQIKSIWRLVYGLLTCGQTMFSTFALLSLVIYVFGVLGVEVISNNTELQNNSATAQIITNHFASLGMTMMTLLQFVTMDSIAPVYTPLALEQPLLLLYFLPLGAIVSISLMNLITAVLVPGSILGTDMCTLILLGAVKSVVTRHRATKVEGALEHARQDREEELVMLSLFAFGGQEMVKFDKPGSEGGINRRILDRASVDSMEELFKILDVARCNERDVGFAFAAMHPYSTDVTLGFKFQALMLRLLRDAVGELQGVPEETTGTTVIRLDGAGKNAGNEDDLQGVADAQPVVLVMQTCSHDAPYGEHFRVQETLRFVRADRGVELQRWVEVIWVKAWALLEGLYDSIGF
ncbi:Scn11a [Symbiodinium sp. CCMP2456]|nr:Scn11a [Symbiodinium sp. CCMP2456]